MSIFSEMQSVGLQQLTALVPASVNYIPYPSGSTIENVVANVSNERTRQKSTRDGFTQVRTIDCSILRADLTPVPHIRAKIVYQSQTWTICEILSADGIRTHFRAERPELLESSTGNHKPNI